MIKQFFYKLLALPIFTIFLILWLITILFTTCKNIIEHIFTYIIFVLISTNTFLYRLYDYLINRK